ncbi:hypothetical protein Tco_1012804 [Tanacetum coccineum]
MILANTAKGIRSIVGYEYGLSFCDRWSESRKDLRRQGIAKRAMVIIGASLYSSASVTWYYSSHVAYRLRLPQELSGIHDTFHVLNLKKCIADTNLHVSLNEINLDNGLRFVEESLEIMDGEVKKLKQSQIPIVKVQWNSLQGPKYTSEHKDEMKRKYPELFMNATSS